MKLQALAIIALAATTALPASALRFEPLNYGDMNSWITRNIEESGVIGGKKKTLYEIGPTQTIDGNRPYINKGGSPWATSNVYAKVAGVTKGSNAVFPAERAGHGRCAKMTTRLESVKVLGLVNMDVMVAGTVFLGQIHEPISSTKNPYRKMEMGVPYTKRPTALVFDYKLDMPPGNSRMKSSGFGKKTILPGHDNAVAYVVLQRRWEDEDGTIHARRVATGAQKFGRSTPWTSGHALNLVYGDASKQKGYDPSVMGLRDGDNAYYTRNSHGKMVKINEEGWDDPSATPTHAIVLFSSGCGEPYVGTEGMDFYVDNVGFGF